MKGYFANTNAKRRKRRSIASKPSIRQQEHEATTATPYLPTHHHAPNNNAAWEEIGEDAGCNNRKNRVNRYQTTKRTTPSEVTVYSTLEGKYIAL